MYRLGKLGNILGQEHDKYWKERENQDIDGEEAVYL